MKARSIHYILLLCCIPFLAGCIKNDLPFPRIQANFVTFEVKGQDAGTAIDTVAMTATVTLPEQVDITSVVVTGYSLTPGARIIDSPFGEPIDLSSPLPVTLSLYQDYTWKIIGRQDIERYFEVAGQIGTSVIDVPGRRVVVYVSQSQSLDKIQITRAKLGPIGSVMTPDIADGATIDASHHVEIEVEAYGRTQIWTLYVEQVDVNVRTLGVDAWSCVAWINGQAEAGKDNGAEYRLAGTEEWTRVPDSDVTHDGGNFTARVIHLSPGTQYQARVYSDELYGDIVDFTTGGTPQMPNSDFDSWWLDNKVWCPWAEDGTPYWGTGNQGAATLGQSNTTPTDDTPTGSGWAAKLETRFVGIGSIGKLAAGNIFVGSYVRTVGTNGVLSFGRPFSDRPVKLRGMFKYDSAPISHVSDEFRASLGQPDTSTVWLALIDTDEPLEIRTDPKDRSLFDPQASYVVAYGKMEWYSTVSQYVPFEFELKYNSTSRVPKYIVVTGSASKYGDYFTGGVGSTLYIDDLELVYDY